MVGSTYVFHYEKGTEHFSCDLPWQSVSPQSPSYLGASGWLFIAYVYMSFGRPLNTKVFSPPVIAVYLFINLLYICIFQRFYLAANEKSRAQ